MGCLRGAASIFSSKDERYRFINRTGYSPWPKPCRTVPWSPTPLPCCEGARMVVGAQGSPMEQRVPFSATVSPWVLQTLAFASHKQIPRQLLWEIRVLNKAVSRLFLSLCNLPPPQQLSLPLCLEQDLGHPSAEEGESLALCLGLPSLPISSCFTIWRHSMGSGLRENNREADRRGGSKSMVCADPARHIPFYSSATAANS